MIRYILQNPHSFEKGVKLHNHLIEKLNTVYFPSETSKIRKDIEKILIISTHEKQSHWTLRFIEDSFCSRKFRIQLDGKSTIIASINKHIPDYNLKLVGN